MTFADFLRKVLPHKELGWKEIGEEFTRFTLLKTPWFRVYLHRLYAPLWHNLAHDHPWDFFVLILRKGYLEMDRDGYQHRRFGSFFFHPAEYAHNVKTGGYDVAWSIVFTGPKRRPWGHVDIRKTFPGIPYRGVEVES
jgi:hypothetical protein